MLYDNNPTIDLLPLAGEKRINEAEQGTAYLPSAETGVFLKSFYVESYGCQMNFSDTEIVASILKQSGFGPTRNIETADLILINTCSIREKAEDTVRKRLKYFGKVKRPAALVGVLGCMAERLKAKFLEEEKLVDIVVGPDAYRDLPRLIEGAEDGEKGVNVFLSREETYADISPVRLDTNGVAAFISIMRGCDNMCSFCVVPFTRGRERSRDTFSIVAEARDLFERGYKEVTLLGQNVDSYKWQMPDIGHWTLDVGNNSVSSEESEVFPTSNVQSPKSNVINFARLLELVAQVHPDLRVRFSTSHPKDITDEVLHTIGRYENICNYIHLPVQSGNSEILKLMNRTYDREWYVSRVKSIYEIIPDCAISSDIITGFCTETEEQHQDTLSIIAFADYTMSYMFMYSERPNTPAAKKYADDVPIEIKNRRLNEIVTLQRAGSHRHNIRDIGKTFKVLIEGTAKKNENEFKGRNSQNKVIVFKKQEGLKLGDYCYVKVIDATSATLLGELVTEN